MARYDRTIPPGEKGTITLELRTKNYKEKIHKTARVISNDPKTPEMTIAITGKPWVPIHISTERVTLRGMLGEEIANTVRVKGQKEKPLELRDISVSIPNKVAVQMHKKIEDGSYLLALKNKLTKEGFYTGEVRIATNYSDQPEIRIRVMGAIMSNVHARPRVLTFNRMSEERLEQLKQPGSFIRIRPVMVYLSKGNNLKIKKVELEKSLFTVTTKELEPGKRYRLLVKPILEKLTKGQNNDLLRIHTNQEHSEILEIPVRFEIFQ